MQSFCYDALNRLVWAGTTGTPTGGDHCGNTPTGTTTPTYQQAYSYDAIDRLTSGPSGAMTYDPTHVHAAITLGQVPRQYASYDAMGNMTCRNVDTTTAHSCDATQNGAQLTYDNEGRLDTWTSPTLTGASMGDQFLYDNAGNRVLQRATVTTSGSTSATDTIYFDGYTETAINGGTSSTVKYYSANGQKLAMKQGTTLTYLVSDLLGNSTLALKSDGTLFSAQLFSPFGSVRYSDSTMPNSFSFTGQRLDSQTGLLYYNFRYYDPVSGRFTRTDTKETNAVGMDTYGYVHGNPETICDPTGHWGTVAVFCGLMIVAAVVVIAAPIVIPALIGAAGLTLAAGTVSLITASIMTAGVGAYAGGAAGMGYGAYKMIQHEQDLSAHNSSADYNATANSDAEVSYDMDQAASYGLGGWAGGLLAGVNPIVGAAASPIVGGIVGDNSHPFAASNPCPNNVCSHHNSHPNSVKPHANKHQSGKTVVSQTNPSHYVRQWASYQVLTSTWDQTISQTWSRSGSTESEQSWHEQANWSFYNQRRAFFG